MAFEIIMPKAGVAMESGTIVEWLVDIGDEIQSGDVILEITTDKVNMEVEAEEEGILLAKTHQEGEELPVFTVIGYIGEQGEEVTFASSENQQADDEKASLEKQEDSKIKGGQKEQESTQFSHPYDYDVVVVGGGPGGYVSAIRGALKGGRIALIEKSALGGTCLNTGCIPTKTYMKNVEIVQNINHAQERGITSQSGEFQINQDIEMMVAYKDKVVKTLTSGVEGLLKTHGVKTYFGEANIINDHEIQLNHQSTITSNNIIIATGSVEKTLPIEGMAYEEVMTSEQMLDLKEVPEKLLIVGGGVIGCEFAQIFHSRGSQVTIIEMAETLVPMVDKDISEALKESFKGMGIQMIFEKCVTKFDKSNRKINAVLNDGTCIEFDKVLVSVGRSANLLGTENLQLEMINGFIKVNDKMETSVKGIYAIGDVNGKSMLAHSASKMGEVAMDNALGQDEICRLNATPQCIYTIPECASVGLTEVQAKDKGNYRVGRFNYGANGRALASGYKNGFVKVIVGDYNEILGIHMFGKGVDEMIIVASHLMDLEIPADEASEIIYGHPSIGEILKEALASSVGMCVHQPPKK